MNRSFFDDATGYEYHFDYCDNFLSPMRSALVVREILKSDFILNCSRFLTRSLNVDGEAACAIVNSMWAMMFNYRRHYHTAYQTMWTFHFAARNNIPLTDAQQLTFWFRNIVYVPHAPSGINERQCVSFMRSVIPDGYRLNDNPLLNSAEHGIVALQSPFEDVDVLYHILSDLDIATLATSQTIFRQVISCLKAELCQTDTIRRFNAMYKKWSDRLLHRNYIFRTELFRNRFEKLAQERLLEWYGEL